MSVRVTASAWRHSRAKGGTLLVLLAIADYANDDGIAWPSVAKLAAKCRLSERQVQRAIRDLERLGELKIWTGAHDYRTSLYEITNKP